MVQTQGCFHVRYSQRSLANKKAIIIPTKKKRLPRNNQSGAHEKDKYQSDSHGSRSELSGDLDDLIQRDVAVVLDVLLLLSVAQRLLERLDDIGRGGRDDLDGSLTVLADQLDSDVQALPGLGSLDDIIGDLLGGLW